MKIGLITDVHNDVVRLRNALEIFSLRGVDQILTIGDTFDPMKEPDGILEIAQLLSDRKVIGVWGNHDYCFCREIPECYIARYPSAMFDYLKTIGPRIELGEMHFSHREVYVDPFDPIQLWDLTGEEIDNLDRAKRALREYSYRLQFVGHYHSWMAFDPTGQLDWNGNRKLQFKQNQRYFVVVAALRDGWCAVLDTNEQSLEPIECSKWVLT